MISDEIYRDGKVKFVPEFHSVEPFPEEGLEKSIEDVIKSKYIKEILSQKQVYGIIHILSHIKEAIEAERGMKKVE